MLLRERHPFREFTPRTDCFFDGGASLYLVIGALAAAGYADYQAGKATQYEAKAEAEETKMAARDAEIQRRRKLIKALAQRNVASGASGTALEGTDTALINRDFSEFSLDSLTGEAMTAARVKSLKVYGQNAKRIGAIRAVGSLLSAGSMAASSLGSIKKAPAAAYNKPSTGVGPYLQR
jgi:hypothetical protein